MIQSIVFPYIRFPAFPSAAFPTRTFIDRPAVETTIEYQGRVFPKSFFSIIDSGADSCVFPSIIGRQLGINIQSGMSEVTLGAAGSGTTFYHSVKAYVSLNRQTYQFDCYAGFLDGLNQFGFGLLGHHGFFSMFESVILDSKRKVVELKVNVP